MTMNPRKVQIELSASQWHSLLGGLDPNSSAYSIVKSAIEINEAPATTPLGRVALMCNEHDTVVLLGVAHKFVPEAVASIEAALESHRNAS
jgi:hypothetical protein